MGDVAVFSLEPNHHMMTHNIFIKIVNLNDVTETLNDMEI